MTELIDHHLNFSNLLKVTTIRVFEKAGDTTYRLLGSSVYPTDYETGTEIVRVVLDGAGHDMKITLQSAQPEGSNKIVAGTTRDLKRI